MSGVNESKEKKETKSKFTLNDLDGKQWIKNTISWFIVNPRPRKKNEITHPGKYPEELVEKYIKFFTKKKQWVIDPFAGIASTLVACKSHQRNAVGIEINEEFIKLGKKRLMQKTLFEETKQLLLQGDSDQLLEVLSTKFGENIPKFHFSISSPPYWNMLGKSRGGSNSQHQERKEKGLKLTYSENIEHDLGNFTDYNEFLDKLVKIYNNLLPIMEDKAYICIVAQNIRPPDGIMKPFAWNLAERLSETWDLRQEGIWCQNNKTLGIWGFPNTYVSNVHHHYCLILQKR